MNEVLLRAVLDINVLVSAYFFGGLPRQVYNAALDKRYRLLHSIDFRADLRRVLSYDKFQERLIRSGHSIDALMESFFGLGEGVTPAYIPFDAVRDKDDLLVLACAVGGKANYIVTGDNDLLILKAYRDSVIVTPAQFLEVLQPRSAD